MRAGLEEVLEDGFQLAEEVEVPAFLVVALIAITVMIAVMWFMGRTGTCEGGGGFES